MNYALINAGRSGNNIFVNKIFALHSDLKFVTDKSSTFQEIIDYTFRGACRGGHFKLVKLLYSKCEGLWKWKTYFASKIYILNGNLGFTKACRGNHLSIINWLIEKGANDWQGAFNSACRGGHLDLAQNLKRQHSLIEINKGFGCACRSGNMALILWMMDEANIDFNYGLMGAARGGHDTLIDFLLEKGAMITLMLLKKHVQKVI